MTRRPWLDRMLESVADRGRELLNLAPGRGREGELGELCEALLSERGEASGVAIAREVVQRYQALDADGRMRFFEMLAQRFAPDPEAVREAAARYCERGDEEALMALATVVTAPRQELFRRMNLAPGGTRALVALRSQLLDALRERPGLRAVDADLRHLLSSWFNRGFLRLERIDWQSPAEILERLIRYEAVHAVSGWDDLRRRLAPDRRCFAFFHPALPMEPLIFVEVALVRGMAERVDALLDPETPVLDPRQSDAAIFYSISNTQRGLRGISFGNFLIKQVVTELGVELPGVRTFATLSPLPHFAEALREAAEGAGGTFGRERLNALLEEDGQALREASGVEEPLPALLQLLGEPAARAGAEALIAPLLERLALAYLTLVPREDPAFDRVATFHLSNGARLERINPFADTSAHGMRASFGVMVNYLYDPEQVEENHEAFIGRGEVRMSKKLARRQHRLAGRWEATA